MRYLLFAFIATGCSLTDLVEIKDSYELEIKGVLTADGLDTLFRDSNGYYHLKLDRDRNQTIRRVTGIILKNGKEPVPPEKIAWESNLYWWLLRGDTVAQITRTYFNPFTGVLMPAVYPPLISRKDELVPTVNCCSYNGKLGEINTIIAPIQRMVGDTMIIQAFNSASQKTAHVRVVLE